MSYSVLPLLFFTLSLVFVYCRGRSHVIDINSFFPSTLTECPSRSTASSDNNKLQIFHRHSSCSPLASKSRPTSHEFLLLDQARAASLKSRVSASRNPPSPSTNITNAAVTIPDHLVLGEYAVTLGLGTPPQLFSVSMDTGSDITWIQCKPCKADNCFPQADPLFDPSLSSTYSNLSCRNPICSHFGSQCESSECIYSISYGDGSVSQGFVATETLTVTPTHVLTNFQFGCGVINMGTFQGTDGLLGLARSQISLAAQGAQKFGNVFSYCLPSTTNSTGFLAFQSRTTNPNTKFTPMIEEPGTPFYFLKLTGLSVGGKNLNIPPSVFSKSGTVIDSGSTVTSLPMPAYTALRDEFRKYMSKYPMAPSLEDLDTCYNFTGLTMFEVPSIVITFAGGASLDVHPSGILFYNSDSLSQVCLAFMGNDSEEDVGIIGNMQQKTYEVVYDVGKGVIGFGPGGCS